MKFLLLFTFCIIILSCKKEYSGHGKIICTDGTLRYSSPALDGTGWSLQQADTSSTFFYLKEASIPDSLRTNNLQVTLCMEETKEKFRLVILPKEENIYKVTSIKRR